MSDNGVKKKVGGAAVAVSDEEREPTTTTIATTATSVTSTTNSCATSDEEKASASPGPIISTTAITPTAAPATTTAFTTAPSAPQLDTRFEPFYKMQRILPEGALRQKMSLEGFSQDEIKKFFSGAPIYVAPGSSESGGGKGGQVVTASARDPLIIECPHCSTTIMIEALNCRIFRCGIFKKTGRPIRPHLKKHECDRLVADKLIHGCGKPFKIERGGKPVICDYI